MSSETRPISPASFVRAIEDLPLENIYAKAYEINNSVAHLEKSNAVLQEYSDSIKNDTNLDAATRAGGDKDCLEAIQENAIVIERQNERVRLLKAEVERRGQLWHEAEPKEAEHTTSGNGATSAAAPQTSAPVSNRLTDDELRRQLAERMGEDEDEEGGLQL